MTLSDKGRWRILCCAAVLVLSSACAMTPRREAQAPRVKDSRPERIASQRAAAPTSLELEPNDERWGIEAAREHRGAEKTNPASAPEVAVPTPPAP